MLGVRGIRGATTSDSNSRDSILRATTEMLENITTANKIKVDEIAAAIFTTTEDLNAEFPTVAAREMGWEYVALLNGHEMRVPGALTQCIRVLLLVNTDRKPQELKNIYLRKAKNLRARSVQNATSC